MGVSYLLGTRYQPRCTGVLSLQPAAAMGVFSTVEGIKFSKRAPIPPRFCGRRNRIGTALEKMATEEHQMEPPKFRFSRPTEKFSLFIRTLSRIYLGMDRCSILAKVISFPFFRNRIESIEKNFFFKKIKVFSLFTVGLLYPSVFLTFF